MLYPEIYVTLIQALQLLISDSNCSDKEIMVNPHTSNIIEGRGMNSHMNAHLFWLNDEHSVELCWAASGLLELEN